MDNLEKQIVVAIKTLNRIAEEAGKDARNFSLSTQYRNRANRIVSVCLKASDGLEDILTNK